MRMRFGILILYEGRSVVVDVQHNHGEIATRFSAGSSLVFGRNRQHIFGYGLAIQI